MKLVFTATEVAEALQYSLSEFNARREKLESVGFPKPLRGLEDRWSIIDVVNWVNDSGDRQKPTLLGTFTPLDRSRLS